ncbi:MAG TPA: ribosome maturation factor RimM [Aliicoccus persicus]|uniref:Ribosome maturation factor RimM n=1 Tax=Aliicoccus persicus TaxID=930138 RepID=A0A921JAZ1_9STAP|nr:ribosome maturation factor RimM [Aliicoccus persicus]
MTIVIGKVVNFHGVKGEVKIHSSSDFIEERLEVGNKISIDETEYMIKSYRQHKGMHLVTFDGVSNLNQVEHLKGHDVYQEGDAIEMALEEGEYHFKDIIGLRVFTMDDREIGMISDILQTGAKDVWVITGDKEYMIPYVDEFVKDIDLEAGTVRISPIEGMIE